MAIFSQLREKPITAVVCFNDMISIGVMRAAKAAGLVIPSDLSVVGFDNIFASDLVTPGLTTVAAPLSLLGEQAEKIKKQTKFIRLVTKSHLINTLICSKK